jgi:hypothetical protein
MPVRFTAEAAPTARTAKDRTGLLQEGHQPRTTKSRTGFCRRGFSPEPAEINSRLETVQVSIQRSDLAQSFAAMANHAEIPALRTIRG